MAYTVTYISGDREIIQERGCALKALALAEMEIACGNIGVLIGHDGRRMSASAFRRQLDLAA